MNPTPSMNGSRSAATSGGRIAFRIATRATVRSAPRKFEMCTPGSTAAAARNASAAEIHDVASRAHEKRIGRGGVNVFGSGTLVISDVRPAPHRPAGRHHHGVGWMTSPGLYTRPSAAAGGVAQHRLGRRDRGSVRLVEVSQTANGERPRVEPPKASPDTSAGRP